MRHKIRKENRKLHAHQILKSITQRLLKKYIAPKIKDKAKKVTKTSKLIVRPKDGIPAIFVGIERGNRMMIKWPGNLTRLTEQLTHDASGSIGNFVGRIEDLKDDAKKKLIPLNYHNAYMILRILRAYGKIRGTNNERVFSIELSDEFSLWFDDEHKASKLCNEAGHLLKYDDSSTVQTVFDFMKKPLYPWQTTGMNYINVVTRQGRGILLCDDTGLGKTITVGSHLASTQLPAVVVCPAGLRYAWKRKLEEFTYLSCVVIGSEYPQDAHEYDVIIISYAMLKKRGLWPLSDIIDNQQRVLVLDEGHSAKNYRTMRTDISLKLSFYAKHSIIATATPLLNRIEELHPLLRIIRRLWTEASLKDFVKDYNTPEGRKDIAEHLQDFMVRRMTNEVWKDAPKGEVGAAWIPLSNRNDYDQAEKDFIKWLMTKGASLDELAAAERGRALVKLNKLRELSALGKVEGVTSIIEKTLATGEQVIVFCAFNKPLKMLAKRFKHTSGTNFEGNTWKGSGIIVGSVLEKKRNEVISDFMHGKIGFLGVGVRSGGQGIDLPIARFAYFLDLPWTPANFEQCMGRLLRIGQTRDCQFIKLLAQHSIDQRLEEIIQMKAHIFKEAIGDQEIIERVTALEATQLKQTVVSALMSS